MISHLRVTEHAAAVAELQDAYQAADPSTPPRLGKRTSNLFRFDRPPGISLDVTQFDRVLWVDPDARVARVQGMTTYEQLVDATLRHDLMPLVVPQLKTITVGGAVSGLGIESSSFRHGLPHESVRELEVLTGDGRVITVNRDQHADLFAGFPNSYGTLGYALSLTIDLVPVRPYVRLRHMRFADAEECAAAISEFCLPETTLNFVDGVMFSSDELYLTLGDFTDKAPTTSNYTGKKIYYRSIQQRELDYLTVRDYLWRWDTDWFWCSRAFGAQHPWLRRVWPRRWLRSDVYHTLLRWDRRFRLSHRWDRMRGRATEPVIQDVEVPVVELARFLHTFQREIGITPVWLCPVRTRETWPLYPMNPGKLYVNGGFWSGVTLSTGQAPDHHNRLVEELVAECSGHKSLYSTVHYSREEFWQRYNGSAYAELKKAYDPDNRLLDLYEKCRSRS